jgi:hypothetical protein
VSRSRQADQYSSGKHLHERWTPGFARLIRDAAAYL